MYVQVRMIVRKFLGSPDACNEGEVRCMYLDNRGFVTTGVGNMLPDANAANFFGGKPLQWERFADGVTVSPQEVTNEFTRVSSPATKSQIPDWQIIGGGNFITKAKTLGIVKLRLTDASFNVLFNSALIGLEGAMKSTPGFEDYEKIPGGFPADAQLGIISVIWANGSDPLKPGKRLGEFSQFCKARRWRDIATLEKYKWSNIRDDRDKATKKVFENAQLIEDQRATSPDIDVTIVSAPFSGLFLTP